MQDFTWEPDLQSKEDDGAPVIREASDDRAYLEPTKEVLQHIGEKRFGMRTVLIPKARNDGRSSAFNPHEAHAVNVDPDVNGGTVVDLRLVDGNLMKKALMSSNKPHEVYRYLQEMSEDREIPAPVARTRSQRVEEQEPLEEPESEAQPRVKQTRRVTNGVALPTVAQMPQIANQEFVQTMPQQPQPQYPGMYPPFVAPQGPDPHTLSILAEISKSLVAVNSELRNMQETQRPEPVCKPDRVRRRKLRIEDTATLPKRPGKAASHVEEEDDEDIEPLGRHTPLVVDEEEEPTRSRKRSSKKPVQREEEDDLDLDEDDNSNRGLRAMEAKEPRAASRKIRGGSIAGFEVLGIPFFTGPIPEKARRRVYFEYPGMGRQTANYHAIVDNDDMVVLVYDTRYEEGTQFEPPNLGAERPIVVHLEGSNRSRKAYSVASMGLSFNLGVLDCIVLVKVREDAEGPMETPELAAFNQAMNRKLRDVENLAEV